MSLLVTIFYVRFLHKVQRSLEISGKPFTSLTVQSCTLTKDKKFVVVDSDSVGTSTVSHGCHGLPNVSGYIISLHSVELPLAVITTHCVQVRIDTHHSCMVQESKTIGLKNHLGSVNCN